MSFNRGLLAAIANSRRRGGTSVETIGKATAGTSQTAYGGVLYCFPIGAPTASGTITSISLYSSNVIGSLNAKFGLYVESSDYPGALVSGSPVTFSAVGTWSLGAKVFSGLSFSVTAGVKYYVGMDVSETSGITVYYDDDYTEAYKMRTRAWDYGTAWPDPANTDGSQNRYYAMQADNAE